MRLRHIALGCALTGGLGMLALPAVPAFAATAAQVGGVGLVGNPGHVTGKPVIGRLAEPVAHKATGPRISVSSPVTDARYDAKVTLTVTLKGAGASREVSLYATPSGGVRDLVATGVVDAKGKWYVRYTMTKTTKFTAVFSGDGRGAPVSASRTLNAYARVTDRLTGDYKTSKVGGGVYHLYHGAGTLTLYSTVAPGKHGECLEPESQQYDKGVGWHADTKYGCDKLDAASRDAAPFSLGLAVGERYRIRGDYLRGKDHSNLDAQGPWLYFIVSK